MAEKKISVALEGKMDSLSQTLQQAERETEKHTRAMAESFRVTDGGIMSVGKSLDVVKGALSALALDAFLRETTQAANQLERASVGLAVTARYAGVGMEAASLAAQSLSRDGLMSVAETSKGLQNLLSRGFSLEESIRLMNAFKDSAAFNRQASLGFGEAVVTATEGLKNENSILVDNAGVTKNVSVMWKEYALQHGTTAEKLTQSQKRIAELNGVLKETEGQAGNAARMADSFAGAQAKAAQQSFELKASLGVAMQPALQGVLTLLSPVVSGLRDMVYWVETLGARAGGTYDKLKIRIEERFRIPNPGEPTGIKERDARIAARLAEVDRNVDLTIEEIVKRSMGPALPDIGKDTGIRRKDTIIPDKDKKAESLASRWQQEIVNVQAITAEAAESFTPWDKAIEEANRKADLLLQKFSKVPGAAAAIEEMRAALLAKPGNDANKEMALDVMNGEGYLNFVGKLSEEQQKAFDITARLNKWEVALADSAQKEKQAMFDHVLAMQGLDESMLQAKLRNMGSERDAIVSQFNFEQMQAEEQLRWKLEHLAGEESEKSRIKDEANRKRAAAEQQLSIELSALEKKHQTEKQNMQLGFANNSMALLQVLGAKNKGAAIAALALQKGLAIGETWVSGKAAEIRALAELGPIAGPPMAAVIEGWTLANMGMIAATGVAEGAMSFGGSGAGGSNSGSGAQPNQVVTQPSSASSNPHSITVHINMENVYGDQAQLAKWVEEQLAPMMRDASSRSVTFVTL